MLVPPVRNELATLLHRSYLRRRWTLACRHADLATLNDRVPRIIRASFVPSGDLLRVRMPAGRPVEDLEQAAETAAAFLEVREVRVARDPANARYARVVVVRRDPLAELAATPWPHLAAPELSLWQPVPVGLDEDGQLVTVSLIERNVLIGGEPGGGKSVGQSMLTATAALDPGCELTLLDGKYVELASWVGCAARTVGPNEGPDNPLGDGGHRLHEWFLNGADSDHKGVPGRPPGVNARSSTSCWPPERSSAAAGPSSRRASGAVIITTACRSSSLPAMRPTVRGASGRWSPM
jgi:hypothetical protein